MELSLDPIIYFYTHSLLVIAVSAVVFMVMGVWIGHLTWAKYKRRARAFQEECDLLRHEIAALKRRIGEETAGPAPLVLINEDAPVPEEVDSGSPLPGFDLSEADKVGLVQTMFPEPVKPIEIASEKLTEEKIAHDAPSKLEPPRESLADVVIGPAGAVHHTLEPVAPPDSIADFSNSEVVSSNGAHATLAEEKQFLSKPQAEDRAKHPRKKTRVPSKAELVVESKSEPGPKPETAVDAETAFSTELAAGVAVSDPDLGILLRSQPDRWDDLTLLRGVGEVLQQRLHDEGVHTFKQIAYWNDANVEAFSSKIEARDRIEREHWVTQARDMHFLKYGEKLA
ncbi:MAG: ribosomal protein [Verrucomicrobiaceae bacterium]|nr:ribosomal protein [Verrucomicrobiaceae bacterium]